MPLRDGYIEQVEAMSKMLSDQTSDLDDERIGQRPNAALNPPGFIYFHLLRVWDLDVSMLCLGKRPEEDIWHSAGISELLGYTPEGHGPGGTGLGFGYNDQEVDEVPYRLEPLRQYHQLLHEATLAYLRDAGDDELLREVTFRDQTTTTGARLHHTLGHSWNHIGELRMTKSMIGYPDPTTPPRTTTA